jgi:HPt (histidine-containing phosphotransfer) domain-containing protein
MEIRKDESQLIDLAPLRNLLGGKEESVAEILNIVVSQIPPSLVEIKSSLEKQDWDALRNKVHTIKSYYGYVGNAKINHMLDEWDAALTRNQPGINHQGIMAELEIKSEAIVQRIRQILLNNFSIAHKPSE